VNQKFWQLKEKQAQTIKFEELKNQKARETRNAFSAKQCPQFVLSSSGTVVPVYKCLLMVQTTASHLFSRALYPAQEQILHFLTADPEPMHRLNFLQLRVRRHLNSQIN